MFITGGGVQIESHFRLRAINGYGGGSVSFLQGFLGALTPQKGFYFVLKLLGV
jgi:hypothetical protein